MDRSIYELFQRLVRVAGGQVAAVDCIEGERQLKDELTYQELNQHALDVAASLQQLPASSSRLLASALRRGNDFYALFLACSFCQIPFVAMSTDLPDKVIEQQRNLQILRELKPQVLIVHSEFSFQSLGLDDVPRCIFASLLADNGRLFVPPMNETTATTLCLQYTGGTTGASRCCIATQQMALWEVSKYKQVVSLTSEDRILQQHSAYWAASLFGEFDIAWSGACALVFGTTTSVHSLKDFIAINQVTCAGLVPTLLDALEAQDMPSLKVVFTWGEALQARTALKWAKSVHLIDLLIASEYWLCLYADWTNFYKSFQRSTNRPAFQAVSDVQIQLIGEDGQASEVKGEMYVSGPFVSPGYLDANLNAEFFKIDGNMRRLDGCWPCGNRQSVVCQTRWYRTRDCLERLGSGYQYAGRADTNVKDGAKWVDTRQVEEEVCKIQGVKEACVHDKSAYICLENFHDDLVLKLRREIPAGHAVYLVPPPLPRSAATGKVDRKALAKLIGTGYTEEVRMEEVCQQSEYARLYLRWYSCLLPLTLQPGYHFFNSEDYLVVAFLLMILEVLLRALLMTYLFLCLVYGMKPLGPYLHYVPGGRPFAFALFAGCCPWWIWIPMLPVHVPLLQALAIYGAWHAYQRQRLFSWPIVVFLNFPRQAREFGLWWYNNLTSFNGWKHICGWYQMKWKQWLDLQLDRGRSCHHCKKTWQDGRGEGKVDESDSRWYCNKCWSHYHNHWQCEKCRCWTLRGGEWQNQRLCSKCLQKTKKNKSEVGSGFPTLEVPLLEEDNQLATPPSPPKRMRMEVENDGPVVTNLVDPAAPTPVANDASTAPKGTGLAVVQTPRGTKVRQLVIPFTYPETSTTSATATSAVNVVKSAEWLEIEEALGGWIFNSLEDTLHGIDSLRFTKMTSNLLRKGKQLPKNAAQCRDLGELLSQVERIPYRESNVHQVDQEWPTWGMMWTSVCGWRFNCPRPIPAEVLRQATEDLIKRHVALRTEMADPMELFHMHQVTLSILLLWRAYSPQFASSWFSGLATWALQSAWPKVKAREPKVDDAVFHVLPPSESFERADALITQKKEFIPPFQLRVAPYPDGVIVQMHVTHMFSDGFCIVPLQQDFAQLVQNRESEERVPLPTLESSFDILQPRLFRTIAGDSTVTDAVTPQALDKGGWSNDVRSEFLQLDPPVVRQVKMGATKLSVSHEILLLSAVGISIAKLHNQAAQTLHVLAPQRDDPYAPDVIGLFVDHRRLEVPVAGLHYAGVALALNNVVKKRQWRQPPVVGQSTAPFVNFMWTDFEEPYGFKPIVAQKPKDNSTAAPIQLAIVQPDRECWRICCTFKAETYSEEQVERFYRYLAEALRCLIEAPLTAVA